MVVKVFRRDDAHAERLSDYLDEDGIPHVGILLEKDSPMSCVGGDPIFFDFDEEDENFTLNRLVRNPNKTAEAKKMARKMLNNNSMALKHLSKFRSTACDDHAPSSSTELPPPSKPVHKTVTTSLFERTRTIVMSAGLARSLTQLAPASQQFFKRVCLMKRACTEEMVTGDRLTWILPDVSERARTRPLAPAVGGWTEWSQYSECSAAPCGDGQQLRFRTCTDPAPNLSEGRCHGKSFSARDCSVPCESSVGGRAEWAPFGPWSECSASCGVGTQQRHRRCRLVSLRSEDSDRVPETDEVTLRRRRRVHQIDQSDDSGGGGGDVDVVVPSPGGGSGVDPALCGGSSREVRVCEPQCALDGQWSEWGAWSACSSACGPGVSTRDRLCGDPPPAGGGRDCEGVGSEVHYCFQRPCTVETRLLAAFNGSGYLIYRPLYIPAALLLVYVRFRPESGDSVLLHRFQNKCPEPHHCDWARLSLVSGFLVLESTMRQCRVKLEGRPAVQIGHWHEVAVAIVGDRAFMRLDNAEEHRKAYLSCVPDGPNYDMDMYVGSDRNRRSAFHGTVSALAVNYMEYSLRMEADWTAGGVPAIAEGVTTSVATADDVYVRLEAADFFTAQCPTNSSGDRAGSHGRRLDFVATFMIRQHGVLMFTRGIEEASFVFVKTGGVFQVCAQLAAARECLASSQSAELDTWYRLRVLIEPKVMTMVVNFVHRTRLMRGLDFSVCRKIVYVGGGPPDTLKKIGESNGFQGLVESFLLNGRRDTSRQMSVKEWGGMVSSAVATLADHYTEAVYQQGHAPALSCDYSDVTTPDSGGGGGGGGKSKGKGAGKNASSARVRWLRLDELIDADSAAVERSPPFSVLRLDPHSKDVQGFYGCLVSTPARTWLIHAFGVSFVRTTVVVAESLAEEWVAVMSALIGCVLLLMAAGLLYASKSGRFGLFPGLLRMIYGERLSEKDQLDYLQLQTGEFVRVTPSRRRLLRPSKQSLLLSRSRHSLATPSRTISITPSRETEFFLEPSKQVRFASQLSVNRTPSGRALTQTPSGAPVTVTGSGRVVTARTLLGTDAHLSPSGRITGYDVDAASDGSEDPSPDGSDDSQEGSDDSGTPLLAGADSPPAQLSSMGSTRQLSTLGSRITSPALSESCSEGYPPPPGTADSGDSEPFSPSYSLEEDKFHVTRYMDEEPARVDSVKLLGDPGGSEILQVVMLILRVEVRRKRERER
ncbi:Hemicentin-1 [Amphibalanus amphitrite]|uniref:Hemicentin-1 n=1 Tax=Amphibalanus amphitrite TaxID=1232801 RepID=A0A6A4WGW8_AMPAM|nr:Hemicentin-1 [Amphibalanus amphitrite]